MEYQLMPEWVLLCAAMLIKSVVQSMLQVWVRIRYQLYATGEDKKLFFYFRKKNNVDMESGEEALSRYSKLWQNDLEGIPLFLLIALGYTLLGGHPGWGLMYFSVFAIARTSYAICYVKGVQPGRGISWDIGLIATLALTIHSAVIAIQLI